MRTFSPPSGYQAAYAALLTSTHGPFMYILQANPLSEVTTRWIAHLESNLRPWVKYILIPPRGYCPASHPPTPQSPHMTYIILDIHLRILNPV